MWRRCGKQLEFMSLLTMQERPFESSVWTTALQRSKLAINIMGKENSPRF